MADRALIIAVENYNKVTAGFVAKNLNGTIDAAVAFRRWLEDKWQSEGVTGTILFCSEPLQAGGRGATSADVIDALTTLEQQGRDTTDNLFVYFSGHGFRTKGETIKLADVLVCADFEDFKHSAAACFKLDALIAGLRESLGPGCHFYFIDACRNEVPKAVPSNIMPFDAQGSEEPSVFVLQSTVAGAPALVGGPFAKMLVQGLRGAGRAKVWDPPITESMKVRFDSLRKFLKDGLQKVQPITQTTNGEKGESDAILATIKPVVSSTLTLTFKPSQALIAGTARIAVFGGISDEHPIAGPSVQLSFPPNSYTVTVALNGLSVTPAGPVDVDLYEDRELVFTTSEMRRGPLTPSQGAGERTQIRLSIPFNTEVLMRHNDTGHESTFRSQNAEVPFPHGTYRTTYRYVGGPVIFVKDLTVIPRQTTDVSPASWHGDAVRDSIASQFPQSNGGVDFSESLGGAVSDPDLGVWLSIIGGGRAMGPAGDYSKIGPLPLWSSAAETPSASPIYVLAGLSNLNTRLLVGVAQPPAPTTWTSATRPPNFVGVHEAVMHVSQGQWFVSFAIDQQPTYTLTSFALPNRCTLIVLTLDDDGQPCVSQYLLPIRHLTPFLNVEVQQRLNSRNQLKDVEVLALMSRAFRYRRRLEKEFKPYELDELLRAKWLDPIGASLAIYECVRRKTATADILNEVAMNMDKYFTDLPDTAAIQRLAGNVGVPIRGVPLFLDGLRTFTAGRVSLPYELELLDFTGPWTAWRGAIGAP